jgi:CRISPR-associated protein Cmr5
MILQNGFGQALAFLRAKGKQNWQDPYNILYKQINEWLLEVNKGEQNFDVLEKIRNGNNDTYRLYTKESLAILIWFRKFAEAELSEEQQN